MSLQTSPVIAPAPPRRGPRAPVTTGDRAGERPVVRGGVGGYAAAMTTIEPLPGESRNSDLRYYLVWPTRRRRPFLDGAILARTGELLVEAAASLAVEVASIASGGDYVIVTVHAPPHLSPLTIVSHLKRHSAGALRREFPEFAKLPSVWTRQFLATTRDDYPPERIARFIESQPRSQRRRYPRPGELPAAAVDATGPRTVEVRRLPPLEGAPPLEALPGDPVLAGPASTEPGPAREAPSPPRDAPPSQRR